MTAIHLVLEKYPCARFLLNTHRPGTRAQMEMEATCHVPPGFFLSHPGPLCPQCHWCYRSGKLGLNLEPWISLSFSLESVAGGRAGPHPSASSLQPTAGPPCFSSHHWLPPPCVGPPQALCDTILRCGFYFWLCFCLQSSFALTRVAQIALRGTTWGRGLGTLGRNPRVLGEQCSTKEEAGFWWAHSLGLLDTLSCGEGTARAGHSKALLLPDPKATLQVHLLK